MLETYMEYRFRIRLTGALTSLPLACQSCLAKSVLVVHRGWCMALPEVNWRFRRSPAHTALSNFDKSTSLMPLRSPLSTNSRYDNTLSPALVWLEPLNRTRCRTGPGSDTINSRCADRFFPGPLSCATKSSLQPEHCQRIAPPHV